jgi:hypothetical protein
VIAIPKPVEGGARIDKPSRVEPPPQGARTNRERLAPLERPAILAEIDKKAADVRMNMTHLLELRLAKEAQEVRTEILPETSQRSQNRKSDSVGHPWGTTTLGSRPGESGPRGHV